MSKKFLQGSRRKPIEYEKELVRYWKENKTFEKSVEIRPRNNGYVFYDGPPFITGIPHAGTLLSSIIKDAVPRYWTMKGKRVERVWGWDCHGLPAEVFTEKKLGIKDKKEIGTKISLEEYITACRDNMVQTGDLWEDTIDRIGRWVDFKGAYKTMDKEYMESIWWAFKELYNKGKIYEGEKVLMYCTRDATPISKAEVAMDNSYQDVTDPSVYVKFKLIDYKLHDIGLAHMANNRDENDKGRVAELNVEIDKKLNDLKNPNFYLLAWTTTPWTLQANTALAVNKNEDYLEVIVKDDVFIIGNGPNVDLDKIFKDQNNKPIEYTVLRSTVSGSDLVGLSYEPLFKNRGEQAHKVWHADFVHLNDGTGIAHEAPAYGEEDYELSKKCGFPMVLDTDEEGFYTEGEWKGKQVWEANKEIAKTLHQRGVVWKIDYITHSYPHCHRCGTKLMYRAHPSWFMDINGQRDEMLEQNKDINWFPHHIKHGRFENTVASAPDWNLSRDRFWATAMPVWKANDAEGKEYIKVIGSYAELKELSGVELDDYHRPWIDDVMFKLDGLTYKRVDKVMDGWFESGSMPFAQFHYPFENTEKFEQNFPGDFIAEYVGQVRAWFYYLHAVSTGLFGKNSFKNVVVTGTLAGNDGRKMSKSFGNYTDPNVLMDNYSADALRFLLLSSPVLGGEDFSLTDKDVADVNRKLAMVWNMYDFFTLYADVDGWEWDGNLDDSTSGLTNPLDKWVVSRVHQLTEHVDKHMQDYNIPDALADILPLIDDVSNWYVRRSRKRFWKSDNDQDKSDAYKTLHYVLVRLSMVMAPFTPFLAEELYQKLTDGESVHLLDWPSGGAVDEDILKQMKDTRTVVEHGLAQRMFKSDVQEQIKIRQPLQGLRYTGQRLLPELENIIADEVNVKKVLHEHPEDKNRLIMLDKSLTPELKREGLVREVIRSVQNARKKAGLKVDDRIILRLYTENKDIEQGLREYAETIQEETLAVLAQDVANPGYEMMVEVEETPLNIKLAKTDA